MSEKKILIFGRTGQVGWELRRTLSCMGEVKALEYPEVNFAQPETLRAVIQAERPRVIVNAAAYTAVDKAESEPELAMTMNGHAPGVLAEEARKLGALLVHYSTDYVFDGSGTEPRDEEASPAPLNIYGRTKLAGDQAIQASGCEHLIFRTSWVYGARGHNFLLTMLRLARERTELRIVDDQVGAPTTSGCIAQATAAVLAQVLAPAGKGIDGRSGIYNLTNGGATSWCGFAQAIFALAQSPLAITPPTIDPILSSSYAQPAKRPSNSRLSSEKLDHVFGVRLPEWTEALSLVIESLAGTACFA
jgi:dTDP-4-dehydrorhamnose reductase